MAGKKKQGPGKMDDPWQYVTEVFNEALALEKKRDELDRSGQEEERTDDHPTLRYITDEERAEEIMQLLEDKLGYITYDTDWDYHDVEEWAALRAINDHKVLANSEQEERCAELQERFAEIFEHLGFEPPFPDARGVY